MMKLRIGTRGSPLALAQAQEFAQRAETLLFTQGVEHELEIVPITTSGDRIQDKPLYDIGGKALFVKELEDALLSQRVDVAVHSCKDIPAFLPQGLELACFLPREDARDAFLSHHYASLAEMPEGATVGTSSPRRAAQIRHRLPHLQIVPLRGNLGTRLRKLEEGEVDATLLAVAGLRRLGKQEHIRQFLDKQHMLPAIAQGAIAVEILSSADWLRALLTQMNDESTAICVSAERSFMQAMQGDCTTPLAAYATRIDSNDLVIDGLLASTDGLHIARAGLSGSLADAEALGQELASQVNGLREAAGW
jgi:hydroxymethylbilane synthase